MKINPNISFAKQLSIYLVIVLCIVFLFISLALTNSLHQFIGSNAYNQARVIASNVLLIFEREISRIEGIPNTVTDMQGELNNQLIEELPYRILKSYPTLIGCSFHYNPRHPLVHNNPHITAYRVENGNIRFAPPVEHCDYCHPDSNQIIRISPQEGYWIYSQVNNNRTIAYCQPIFDNHHTPYGIIKIDFSLKTITDLICNYKLFKSGYLFIVDQKGKFIAHPDSEVMESQTIFTRNYNTEAPHINHKIVKGETGEATIILNGIRHYIYYTPIHLMNWRLGIIYPYSEILHSSHKLYIILFLCLGFGLIFLFAGIINIVHRLSSPLKQLAFSARRIAEGEFDIRLTMPNSTQEICELYDSFHYLQQNLVNYIERLQTTTAEKEQLNSEMRLARRIQQRFLPHHIQLPPNIKLAAELRQCREVGGDMYEFFLIDNHLYFATGDVSGKGTPAALYMASFSKLFSYIASHHTSTATICNIINKHMCDDADDDMYITMFMGILNIDTGIMTFTNAGHPYPLIIHRDGNTSFLNKYPDVPIGVLEDHCFSEHTYTLQQDTTLLFYTDGITDAENMEGQFYGQENMIKCVQSVACQSPENIIQALLEEIKNHIGDRRQSDDLTLLTINYKEIPEETNVQ